MAGWGSQCLRTRWTLRVPVISLKDLLLMDYRPGIRDSYSRNLVGVWFRGQHEFAMGGDFYEICEASHLDSARIFCSLAVKTW